MFKFPPVQLAAAITGHFSSASARCAWSNEPFGSRYLKRYRFWAAKSWVLALWRACPCHKKGHIKLTWRRRDGHKIKTYGIKLHLVRSAAYPRNLGRGIVEAWSARKVSGPRSPGPADRAGIVEAWSGQQVSGLNSPAHRTRTRHWKEADSQIGAQAGQPSKRSRSWKTHSDFSVMQSPSNPSHPGTQCDCSRKRLWKHM